MLVRRSSAYGPCTPRASDDVPVHQKRTSVCDRVRQPPLPQLPNKDCHIDDWSLLFCKRRKQGETFRWPLRSFFSTSFFFSSNPHGARWSVPSWDAVFRARALRNGVDAQQTFCPSQGSPTEGVSTAEKTRAGDRPLFRLGDRREKPHGMSTDKYDPRTPNGPSFAETGARHPKAIPFPSR